MTQRARERGLNDRQWTLRAGLRPETLSRIRRRGGNGDAATLASLAQACGLTLVAEGDAMTVPVDASGLFPLQFDRALEERLLALCASGDVDPAHWRALGPGFFVGGLAALLSCTDDLDADGRYAKLAEALHPGVSAVDTFRTWLHRSPVKASRFLPMLRKELSQRQAPSSPAPRAQPRATHAPQQSR